VENVVMSPEDQAEKDTGGDLPDLVPDLPGDERRLRVVKHDARIAVVPAVLLVDDRLDGLNVQRAQDVLQASGASVHHLPAPGQGVGRGGGQPGGEAARADDDRTPAVTLGGDADSAVVV